MADFNIYEELMPKIQALIAPPENNGTSSNSKEKSSSDSYPYFKRRSKRHNHDYCDACGERGNVLSCDICPASFHLLCHDPPLNEKEVSNGHWICHACQCTEKNEQTTSEATTMETSNKEISHEQITTVKPSPEKPHEQTKITPIKDIEPQLPTNINDLNLENSNSNILDDTVRIKDECLEEENIVSELDESGDEITIENTVIKTECDDEFGNNECDLVFPLKTEPETFECRDSAEENDNDVLNVNMDDVWKIIGVNEQVKVNTDKTESRKSSKDTGCSIVSKSSIDETATILEAMTHKQIHVRVPNCDYLLKNRKISCTSNESTEEPNKKRAARKPKKNRRKMSVPKNESHANGIKRIFSTLINDAAKMNSKQFSLPVEYTADINLNLIGTEKDPDSFPNDLDSTDLLKLPARKCYYCKGTCLTGQMISCDFCPAHFHLNCLNPPLCSIPDVKWMCPLHPHHVLDRVMKNPSSITELMSWWSKFSTPIDDDDVKSNFIKKVTSVKKIPTNGKFIRSSVKIPDIVKYHYQHPPPRVPSLRELVNSKNGCVFENEFVLTDHDLIEKSNNCCTNSEGINMNGASSEFETSMDRSSQNALAEDHPVGQKKYNLRPFKKAKWKDLIEVACLEKNCAKKSAEVENKKGRNEEPSLTRADNGVQFASHGIYQNINTTKEPKAEENCKTDLCWRSIENFIIRDINRNFITGSDFQMSDPIEMKTMICSVNQPFFMQHVFKTKNRIHIGPTVRSIRQNNISLDGDLHDLSNNQSMIIRETKQLKNRCSFKCGISVTTLSEDLRRLLLIEKIKQYTRDLPPSFMPNTNPYPLFHPLLKDNIRDALPDKPKGNVKAVLCPLSHRPLVYMYGQSLSIGSGFSNDICLLHYGNCNFISDEHAVIFYDKTTNTYELINYSEYNTIVDGVCYTCDISRNDVPKEPPKPKDTSPRKPIARTLKRKISIPCNSESRKKTGSTVMAAEARSIYKKLLQDIDKLVHKSQEEMNSVAEEDLNEIAKAIKNAPQDYRVNQKEEKKKVKKRTPSKRNEKSPNGDKDSSAKAIRKKRTIDEPSAEEGCSRINGEKDMSVTLTRLGANSLEKQVKTRTTPIRKRRKKLTRPRKLKKTKTEAQQDGPDGSSEQDNEYSDEEYLLGDKFFVNPKRSQCRCQAAEVKFPNGRDSSWERTAPLNHGSYVRFGCIEFIFSIINYPPPNEERIYSTTKQIPAPVLVPQPEPVTKEPPPKIFIPPKKDDLSLKLISILNVLSSKNTKSPASSPTSSASTTSSPFSSRSSSPTMVNGDVGRYEIAHADEPQPKKCQVNVKRKIKGGKIEITG